MSLKDIAAKAGLWEKDGEAPPPVVPPKSNLAQVLLSTSPGPGLNGMAQPPTANPVYDTLVAHTSFEATDVGKVYAKYYAKLTRITDEHQRRATAIDLASNDGIDAAAFSKAFDQVESQLQGETDRFSTACDARLQRDYTEPKAKLDGIIAQIDQLQQEKAALQASLQPAFEKVNFIKSQFQAAWERRSLELKQQRALFTEGR